MQIAVKWKESEHSTDGLFQGVTDISDKWHKYVRTIKFTRMMMKIPQQFLRWKSY